MFVLRLPLFQKHELLLIAKVYANRSIYWPINSGVQVSLNMWRPAFCPSRWKEQLCCTIQAPPLSTTSVYRIWSTGSRNTNDLKVRGPRTLVYTCKYAPIKCAPTSGEIPRTLPWGFTVSRTTKLPPSCGFYTTKTTVFICRGKGWDGVESALAEWIHRPLEVEWSLFMLCG